MLSVWHAFLHYSGSDNVSGAWYGWWSGAAGDLSLLGVFVVLWRKHNCHVRGCWRIQWRTSGDHVLCRKHHPHDPPTADQL